MPYNSSSEERKREREKKAYQQRQRDLWKQEDERNYILQQIEKKEKERVVEERRLWNERRIRREEKRRQHEIESKNSALLAGMHRILEEMQQKNDVMLAELRDKLNKEDELFSAEFWAANAKRAAEYKKRKALEATKDEVIVDISHDHVVSEEIIVEYHAPPIEELDDVHDGPVVCDVEDHDRIFLASDPIDEELNIDVMEATQDEMVECHDDLVDIPCVELPEDAPVILVGDGNAIAQLKEMQATHMYYDPFLLHCTPFNFVIADFYALELKLYKRMITVLFTSFILLDIVHSECLLVLVCPRLLFDPGGFEGESFRTGRE